MADIRGNVDTRLARLQRGEYAALVLAEAGLQRLGLEQSISQRLPKTDMLPAVGQGALGIETRSDDAQIRAALAVIDDPDSHAAVIAERTMLANLAGGCLAPIGAWARLEAGQLTLSGVVLGADGVRRLAAEARGLEPEILGRQVADALLAQGAADLIAASRRLGD
jgi:hydroxymethylbilane synthase